MKMNDSTMPVHSNNENSDVSGRTWMFSPSHHPFSVIHATNSSSITSAISSISFGKISEWPWRTQSTAKPVSHIRAVNSKIQSQ